MAELKHLVRVANTDLEGQKQIIIGLTKIKGVGKMISNAVCRILKIDAALKVGALEEKQIKQIEEVLYNPHQNGIPEWMLNRRKDPETGETSHKVSNDLMFLKDTDLKRLKKIKCYRGIRHMSGLPSRGQRTKSNFRKNKGKVVGVKHAGKKR